GEALSARQGDRAGVMEPAQAVPPSPSGRGEADYSDHIDVASLEPMFRPASVAIIGASSDPARIGGMPLAFMKANRFAGPIYPVNPRAPVIQDLPAFPSIRDIGKPVDLALIAVPAVHVIPSLEACVEVGVRAVVIFTSGLAQIDEAGL